MAMLRNYFKINEATDYYEVFYQKTFKQSEIKLDEFSYPGLVAAFDTASFKIRKTDLSKKEMTIDSLPLAEYVLSGLKILVGIDFDLTISNSHTLYYKNEETLKPENLKGGDHLRKVLMAIDRRKNLYPFIASLNHFVDIEKHLKSWGISQYFNEIVSRTDFYPSSAGDKDICFRQVSDRLLNNPAIDINRFLDLDAKGKVIDIIQALLIDDDLLIDYFPKKFGINVIHVNKEKNNIEHLQEFDREYLNGEIFSNNKSNTTTAIQKAYPQLQLFNYLLTEQYKLALKNVVRLVCDCHPESKNTFTCHDGSIFNYANGWSFYHDKFCEFTKELSLASLAKIIKHFFPKSIHASGHQGQILLHFFATSQDERSIEILLKDGANPNHRDKWGNTPLHLLIGMDSNRQSEELPSHQLIQILISANANFNIENDEGKTFQDLLVMPDSMYDMKDESLELIAYLYTHADIKLDIDNFKKKNALNENESATLNECMRLYQKGKMVCNF